MRIGYLIDTQRRGAGDSAAIAASMDAMIEEGLLAERAGFHAVVVPDRHRATESHFPGPEQLLTLLARETERVALGSFTFVRTLVHPMKAAEQFSVVDNLSGGRVFTTVSRGFLSAFWGQFGIPEQRLLGRFRETIDIWHEAFTGEPFDYQGDHWQVRDGRLAPPPYQPGGWPIWGVATPRRAPLPALPSTARAGPPTRCRCPKRRGRSAPDAYRNRARALGKRPFVVAMRDGWVADSFEDAAGAFGDSFLPAARFYLRTGRLSGNPDFTSESDVTVERLAPYLVLGTAEQCVERLELLQTERGVDYVVLCCRLAHGPPRVKPVSRSCAWRGGRRTDPRAQRPARPPRHPGRLPLVTLRQAPARL